MIRKALIAWITNLDVAIIVFVITGVGWNAFRYYRISAHASSCGEGCLVLFVFWLPGAAVCGVGALAASVYGVACLLKSHSAYVLAMVLLTAIQMALVVGIVRL